MESLQEDSKRQDNHEKVGLEVGVEPEARLAILHLELLDHVRIEIALCPDALVGQEVLDPLHALPQEIGSAGGAKSELLPMDDLGRDEPLGYLLDNILFHQIVQL